MPSRPTAHYHKLRRQVVKNLGDVCQHCGFADYRALQLDHVEQRKRGSPLGSSTYELNGILRGERVGVYQLLCANCNWIKRHERNEQPATGRPRSISPTPVRRGRRKKRCDSCYRTDTAYCRH